MSGREKPLIVVAYDGSGPARAAVRYAAARAGSSGKVIVVHCFGRHSEDGQAVLDDLMMTDAAVLTDVDFEVELIGGEAAETVNEIAEASNADEIVLGTRGSGKIASLLGSVAQEVIRHATLPVVVIPNNAVRERA